MNILFLCVGNSARSQIAEGLAREMFSEKFKIESAGSEPVGYIHDGAIQTMSEIGIDISNQYSKSIGSLNEEFLQNLDFIITLCAEEICPSLNNKAMKVHWPNPDPALENISSQQRDKIFRNTRENIFNLLKKISLENNFY